MRPSGSACRPAALTHAGLHAALGLPGREPHQTGGATKRPLSGSLNDFCATNSFIAFAVPHWSRDLGVGEVVQVRVPGVLVDQLELGRVLDGVAVRVEEVAEGVVARQVPAGAPDLLDAGAQQAAGAAHVLVDAAHLERRVVQRGVRAAGDGHAVVPCVDPHEPHHLAHARVHQGVGQGEGQVLLVEGAGALGVGGVDDDVREADRDRLALLDLAVLPDGDVGADLDGAALVVEEPEAVAAAGGLQRVRLADELDAVGGRAARRGCRRRRGSPRRRRSGRSACRWPARSRTTYCSGDPSAARKAMPESLCSAVRPQVLV